MAFDESQHPRHPAGGSDGGEFANKQVFVHGSPKVLNQLAGGSMFSDDPTWAAGYTTKFDWAGRESFAGGMIHHITVPAGRVDYAPTVHKSEEMLWRMAEKISGRQVTSLWDAANIVADHTDLVAILAKRSDGYITGGILVRPAKVHMHSDPVAALKQAIAKDQRVPDNLHAALRNTAKA